MDIKPDNLSHPAVVQLLQDHVDELRMTSPPESTHVLDLDGLRERAVTLWVVWNESEVAGCGALKQLTPYHGEIKSMRTATEFRGRGVGTIILQHLIDEGRRRGYQRLSLETGSMDFFEPARRLYLRFGFTECEPFADYQRDPNSIFMTLDTGHLAEK